MSTRWSMANMEQQFAETKARLDAIKQAEADAAGITVAELDSRRAVKALREREAEAEGSARAAATRARIPSRSLVTAPMLATDALQTVLAYDVGLLGLSGGVGTGKSFAAATWAMLDPGGALWLQAAELARGYAYDDEAMRRVLGARRLVIDDLGTEYLDQSGRYLATLAEVLETRFARKRPTLITTNCVADVFRARYGERIASRIAEDGAFVVVGGPDLRRARGGSQ